jgi:hypothetical protein
VTSAEVDRDGQKEQPRPSVDGVEEERLFVADVVPDQPDDEPDQGHGVI